MIIKTISAKEKNVAQITESNYDPAWDMEDETIGGPTLYTLISAGTELNGFLDGLTAPYGMPMGYAAVFRVENVGDEVEGFEEGDLAMGPGPHTSYQVLDYRKCIKVPEGVLAQEAAFARLCGVSMSTLALTHITPPEYVLVYGLGCVGLMAAQCYQACGYRVIAVEPDAHRREVAMKNGIAEVFAETPFDDERYEGRIGLVLECSGNEAAALEGCKMLRIGGELSQVGVPWVQKTENTAHELLDLIFHKVIKVYSSWEHQVPLFEKEFNPVLVCDIYHGISGAGNYRRAMELLAEGKVTVKDEYVIRPYTDIVEIYDDIRLGRTDAVSTVLNWQV